MVRFNKKGDSMSIPKTFFYFIFIMIFCIYLIFYVLMIKVYFQEQHPMPKYLDVDLAYSRITNVCFAYYDQSTGEYYQNILDETKFTIDNLRDCFATSKGFEGVKVILLPSEGSVITLQTSDENTKGVSVKRPCLFRSLTGKILTCQIEVIK